MTRSIDGGSIVVPLTRLCASCVLCVVRELIGVGFGSSLKIVFYIAPAIVFSWAGDGHAPNWICASRIHLSEVEFPGFRCWIKLE